MDSPQNTSLNESTPSSREGGEQKPRPRTSLLASLFGIVLIVLLVLLTNMALFDANRAFNPLIVETQATQPRTDLLTERSSLLDVSVQYPRPQKNQYELYRLLIHSAIVIPIALIAAAFWIGVRHSSQLAAWRAASVAIAVFALWIFVQWIGEVGHVLMTQYKQFSLYGLLLLLALLCLTLVVGLQRRKNAS